MEYLLVIAVALGGAFLSFFSGFGLGTLLLPVFMLFFPPGVAIAATALVHMLNNLFKLFLVGRYADRQVLLWFGALSVAGAALGAWSLGQLSVGATTWSWTLGSYTFDPTNVEVILAIVILLFTFFEANPAFQQIQIPRRWLPLGGLFSGFFGGFSGHQGALRSAFLMKAGLSKEAFMGTRVVLACFVDLTRIGVYATQLSTDWTTVDLRLVAAGTLAAFTGAWLGNRYMKKTEMAFIHRIVVWTMVVFAIALVLGWL